MTRHPIRWSSLVFGLLFLAGVGQWAVREENALSSRELSLTISAVLIVLGMLGVVATVGKPRRPARSPRSAESEPAAVDDHLSEDQPSKDQPSTGS